MRPATAPRPARASAVLRPPRRRPRHSCGCEDVAGRESQPSQPSIAGSRAEEPRWPPRFISRKGRTAPLPGRTPGKVETFSLTKYASRTAIAPSVSEARSPLVGAGIVLPPGQGAGRRRRRSANLPRQEDSPSPRQLLPGEETSGGRPRNHRRPRHGAARPHRLRQNHGRHVPTLMLFKRSCGPLYRGSGRPIITQTRDVCLPCPLCVATGALRLPLM